MEKSITRKDAYIVRVEEELEKTESKLKTLAETSEKSYVLGWGGVSCSGGSRVGGLEGSGWGGGLAHRSLGKHSNSSPHFPKIASQSYKLISESLSRPTSPRQSACARRSSSTARG